MQLKVFSLVVFSSDAFVGYGRKSGAALKRAGRKRGGLASERASGLSVGRSLLGARLPRFSVCVRGGGRRETRERGASKPRPKGRRKERRKERPLRVKWPEPKKWERSSRRKKFNSLGFKNDTVREKGAKRCRRCLVEFFEANQKTFNLPNQEGLDWFTFSEATTQGQQPTKGIVRLSFLSLFALLAEWAGGHNRSHNDTTAAEYDDIFPLPAPSDLPFLHLTCFWTLTRPWDEGLTVACGD